VRGLQLQRASSTEIDGGTPLHGGTELIPLLRAGIVQTDALVYVRAVVPCGIDGTRIGAKRKTKKKKYILRK